MMKKESLPKSNSFGFTLIELLIVIVVIGILSGVLISVIDPVRIYNRGRYAKATADMNKFISAVEIARVNTGLTLRQITGKNCTACLNSCNVATDLRNNTGACYNNWIAARDAVQNAAGGQVDLSSITRDPWGSPYLLDENEGEYDFDPCRRDSIFTAGIDGAPGGSDEQVMLIPFYNCSN